MKLKVLEAYTRDVGRSVARIDYDTMDKLDLTTGDSVELRFGKKSTPAKVLPLYPADEKKKLVRIDGLTRENLGIKIALQLEISKVGIKPALQVKFFPEEDIPPLDGRYLSDTLESVPVKRGTIVMIPYFGGRLKFKVVDTKPKGIVQITQSTESVILEQNIPPEVTLYEKNVKKEKNKIIRHAKTEIQKLLKEKKYKEANEFAKKTQDEINDLEESYKALKKLLRKVEEEEDDYD